MIRASMLTLSITSKKTSFFRYLIPSDLHETAFVTAIGGRTCTSSWCDSCVMYLEVRELRMCVYSNQRVAYSCKILLSVVWGYPKSIISSMSSYIITKLSRIDSSSSSLKYSTSTVDNLCKNMMISATFVLRFESASTIGRSVRAWTETMSCNAHNRDYYV